MATKTVLYATDFSDSLRAALAVACSLARDLGGRLIVLHVVPSLEAIREAEAEETACDLIVMGTHGKTKIRRALLGSVAEQVMRQASCPVVVVRQPTAAR